MPLATTQRTQPGRAAKPRPSSSPKPQPPALPEEEDEEEVEVMEVVDAVVVKEEKAKRTHGPRVDEEYVAPSDNLNRKRSRIAVSTISAKKDPEILVVIISNEGERREVDLKTMKKRCFALKGVGVGKDREIPLVFTTVSIAAIDKFIEYVECPTLLPVTTVCNNPDCEYIFTTSDDVERLTDENTATTGDGTIDSGIDMDDAPDTPSPPSRKRKATSGKQGASGDERATVDQTPAANKKIITDPGPRCVMRHTHVRTGDPTLAKELYLLCDQLNAAAIYKAIREEMLIHTYRGMHSSNPWPALAQASRVDDISAMKHILYDLDKRKKVDPFPKSVLDTFDQKWLLEIYKRRFPTHPFVSKDEEKHPMITWTDVAEALGMEQEEEEEEAGE